MRRNSKLSLQAAGNVKLELLSALQQRRFLVPLFDALRIEEEAFELGRLLLQRATNLFGVLSLVLDLDGILPLVPISFCLTDRRAPDTRSHCQYFRPPLLADAYPRLLPSSSTFPA